MKGLLAFMLALLLSATALVASTPTPQPPKGFAGEAYQATFALFGHKTVHGQDAERFLCTVWNYKKIDGGYDLISAGHCVVQSGADSYSVAETIGGPEFPVTVLKAEMDSDFDFAAFEFKTDKEYPVLTLGTVATSAVGDSIINPNFALGATKQVSLGAISSGALADGFHSIVGEFLVQVFGYGGSSGSPIIAADSHTVIGILIDSFHDGDTPINIGVGIEPIDRFADFLTHVVPPPAKKEAAPAITTEEFNAKYGPNHPFKLTVHGPNPTFEVGGHTFKAGISGFELHEGYYYKVKVYIDRNPGGYLLVSTKKPHPSVYVILAA